MLNKKILFNALVSSLGAFLCITFLAFLNGIDESTLWLIPPFGASMVLVMSAHDSPLAQPKNIFFWPHFVCFVWSGCKYFHGFKFFDNRYRNRSGNFYYDYNKNSSSTSWWKPNNSSNGFKIF